MIVKLLHPQIKAYNAFTHNQIPGVSEADTDALIVTLTLGGGPVATTRRRSQNFYLKVDNDAPDEIKRLYPRFVDPQFAPPPEV